MHTMHKEDPGKVLVAAAIGFAAGMLLAPRSGRETRDQLRVQAEEVKSRAKLAKDDLRHHMAEGREDLKKATANARDRSKSLKDDIVKDFKKSDSDTTLDKKAM